MSDHTPLRGYNKAPQHTPRPSVVAGTQDLLPRASLMALLHGEASLIGARLDASARRGLFSPVEARLLLGIPYGDLLQEEARYLAQRSVMGDVGLITRALFAKLLSLGGARRIEPRPWIVSAYIDNLSIAEALDAITAPPKAAGARMIHFVHPHALNLAVKDTALSAALRAADLVLPDGIGVRLAAALLGVSLTHNINGTDLLPLLCQRAIASGTPLALIGGAPGVALECAKRLKATHPGLKFALISHGFLTAEESRRIAARLRSYPGVIALVGMGSPLQESWARRYLSELSGAVLTVGGLFDFFSGRVPRAPMAWRELGLEWVYRLLQEPRRMARRYLLGNPLFLLRAFHQKLLG